MKLTGVHIAILVGLAVVGLVAYGGYKYQSDTPVPVDKGASEEGMMPPVSDGQAKLPKIVVEPDKRLDMGVIPRVGDAPSIVKVYNKGDATLEIMRVNTSCGCTKAKIDEKSKLIPPGGSADITVTVNPKMVQGFESTKTLTISSNDPAQPRHTMEVHAKIDPEFAVEPSDLDFGAIHKGVTVEKTVSLRQLTDEVIEISDIKAVGSGLQVSFSKKPENEWAAPGKAEYLINVKLTDEAPLGSLNSRLAIKSTCSRLPNYYYNIKGSVESFYTISPQKALILRPDTKLAQTVKITGKQPMELASVETSFDKIHVEQAPGEAPNSYELKVNLLDATGLTFRNESILLTLKSGDEVVKERVPVRIYVSNPTGLKAGQQPGDAVQAGQPLDVMSRDRNRPNGIAQRMQKLKDKAAGEATAVPAAPAPAVPATTPPAPAAAPVAQ